MTAEVVPWGWGWQCDECRNEHGPFSIRPEATEDALRHNREHHPKEDR